MEVPTNVAPEARKFFTFEPVDVINDVVNSVTQYVSDCGDALEDSLQKETNTTDESVKEEIRNGCKQLVKVLTKNFQKNFKIFEEYSARNIFTVDPALQLDADSKSEQLDVEHSTMEETDAALDRQIAQLRVKREQGLRMQQKMESELEESRQFKKLYLSFVMDSENLVRDNQNNGERLYIPKEGIEQMLEKVKDLKLLRERQAMLQKQLLKSQSVADLHNCASGVFQHETDVQLQNAFRKDHSVAGAPSIATLSSQALTA